MVKTTFGHRDKNSKERTVSLCCSVVHVAECFTVSLFGYWLKCYLIEIIVVRTS